MTTTYSLSGPMIHQDSLLPETNNNTTYHVNNQYTTGLTAPGPASQISIGTNSNSKKSEIPLEYSYPTSNPTSSVPPAFSQSAEAARKKRFTTIIVVVVCLSIIVGVAIGAGVYLGTKSNASSNQDASLSSSPKSTLSSSRSSSASSSSTTDSTTTTGTSSSKTSTSTTTTSSIQFTPTPAPVIGQRFIVKHLSNVLCLTGSSEAACDTNDSMQLFTAINVDFAGVNQIYWQQAASSYCWNLFAFKLKLTNCDFDSWKVVNYNKALGQIQSYDGLCLNDDLSTNPSGTCGTFQIIYV